MNRIWTRSLRSLTPLAALAVLVLAGLLLLGLLARRVSGSTTIGVVVLVRIVDGQLRGAA